MSSNNINSVVVNGRLTDDPKLHETSGGNVYAILPLAVNSRNRIGKTQPVYIDAKIWNAYARTCVRYLAKGWLVTVRGQIEQYDDPESKKRWTLIAAKEVEFLSPPRSKADDAKSSEGPQFGPDSAGDPDFPGRGGEDE